MLWLYRYLCGYLKVIIKGEFNENILNICAVNGIIIWKSKLIKKNIETHILIKDFKKLRKLMRGSNTRIHILKKTGLPFKLNRNKDRFGLLFGDQPHSAEEERQGQPLYRRQGRASDDRGAPRRRRLQPRKHDACLPRGGFDLWGRDHRKRSVPDQGRLPEPG